MRKDLEVIERILETRIRQTIASKFPAVKNQPILAIIKSGFEVVKRH